VLGAEHTMYGHIVGRKSYLRLGDLKVYPNLYMCLTGTTGHGAKGTSQRIAKEIVESTIPKHQSLITVSGIGSGEVIVERLRDPSDIVTKGILKRDDGVLDKRLLGIEEEFGSILANSARNGDKTSLILRKAWDSETIENSSLANPLKATLPHLSLIGHITIEELKSYLHKKSDTSTQNGFCNRFLWIKCEANKCIPIPKAIDVDKFSKALNVKEKYISSSFGIVCDTPKVFELSKRAEEWWINHAEEIQDRHSPIRTLTARSRVQVLKLALISAILDDSHYVEETHLELGYALVKFSNHTVAELFANGYSRPALRVLRALKESERLTRTQICHDVLSGNKSRKQIDIIQNELRTEIQVVTDLNTTYWELASTNV
jgi:hypothetical protein